MLLPLTVLWVSVTAPVAKIPPPLARISRGAVAADGALGERHGAIGTKSRRRWAVISAVLFPLTVLW